MHPVETPRLAATRAATLIACVALAGACGHAANPGLGIVIKNVRIIDGTGAAARIGAVRIELDTIVQVGNVAPGDRDSVVDVGGLILAPGFIDTHSHHTSGIRNSLHAVAVDSLGRSTGLEYDPGIFSERATGSRSPTSPRGMVAAASAISAEKIAGSGTRLTRSSRSAARQSCPCRSAA